MKFAQGLLESVQGDGTEVVVVDLLERATKIDLRFRAWFRPRKIFGLDGELFVANLDGIDETRRQGRNIRHANKDSRGNKRPVRRILKTD